ncbi:MAG: RpoL/Rpb11 RNA polymerase subunit family protein [Thermoprotei archaeon]
MEIEERSLGENTSEFILKKEDHTLANALSFRLQSTAHVVRAGYRVPHPLTKEVAVMVKTDGKITPLQALTKAAEALSQDFERVSKLV